MVTTVNVHSALYFAWNEIIGYLNFILTISLWQGDILLSYQQFVVFV